MFRKNPLIVILGSTGVGKTKLSIELAQRYNGEIISADSMQVYSDLDIVTAKATKEEQSKAVHHMLDVAQPSEPFTVIQYRNAALPIIEELLAKSKTPIICGGTNYYIESLLWDVLVTKNSRDSLSSSSDSEEDQCESSKGDSFTSYKTNGKYDTIPSVELHAQLVKIDPKSAGRLHPNNKRKILRALEVHEKTGKTLSEILEQQRNRPGGNRLGGPLRFPHTILLWLQCNQDVLNQRLDKRVDMMLRQGLIKEVRGFYEKYVKQERNNEFTKGVLQTIGFKEFAPYLELYDITQDKVIEEFLEKNSFIVPEILRDNHPDGLNLLKKCLESLKLVTRRYSKKQLAWINNRFLGSQDRQVPSLYALDTSNVSKWNSQVFESAIDVIDSYLNDKTPKMNQLEKIQHPAENLNEEVSNFCEICQRHFIGEFQWQLHLKSNKHKRALHGQNKRRKLEHYH